MQSISLRPAGYTRAVRSSRWVDNLHVAVLMLTIKLLRWGVDSWVVIGKLEESLETTTRVLRALTVVTVWQRED